jgi:hypothetical protein
MVACVGFQVGLHSKNIAAVCACSKKLAPSQTQWHIQELTGGENSCNPLRKYTKFVVETILLHFTWLALEVEKKTWNFSHFFFSCCC